MGRDAVLEGARRSDLEQLRLLAQGRSATATAQQLAQIEAKARMLMNAAGVEPGPIVAAAKALAEGGHIAELTDLLP